MTRPQPGTREKLMPCLGCWWMPRRWVKTRWLVFKSYFVRCGNKACGLGTAHFPTTQEADAAWMKMHGYATINQVPGRAEGGV